MSCTRTPRIAAALFLAVSVAPLLAGFSAQLRAREQAPAAAILQDLRNLLVLGTVLHVGAHPDDENTQLITYLARGRGLRTAYLSVTRGDGGQNLLGPELGEKLGVARTQELLAARRIDGGQQFFTRAIDFGFSKDYRETLNVWGHQEVLSDVVRVIRTFRPDVIVTRFSPEPGGTHGHHTTSAVLALEAFKIAGDPKAFPEQLKELRVWQPKRILVNGRGGGAGGDGELRLDVSGDDPVLGESFGSIASRSRGMHKTQGFGVGQAGGGGGGRGGRGGGAMQESFQLLAGEPASTGILDGVNTSWSRVLGGATIGPFIDSIITRFDPQDVAASVPALLTLRSRVGSLRPDPLVAEKRLQLDRILQTALGLEVGTVVAAAEAVPGEAIELRHTATVSSAVPVRWVAVRYPRVTRSVTGAIVLRPNQPSVREATQTLPANMLVSQPYWLRDDGTTGLFRVDEPALIGRPENSPAFPVEQVFEVGGQTLVILDEPVHATDGLTSQQRRRLDVIAPATLRLVPEVALFAPGAARPVAVEVSAMRAGVGGMLRLDAPAGWVVTPATQSFQLSQVGEDARFTFTVTAPRRHTSAILTASIEVNGRRYNHQRIEIRYDHIPVQLLQPPARVQAVSLDLAIKGREVGYLPGAGDQTAEALEQMGYRVTTLNGADLTPDRLRPLDAVVFGVRAFNVRSDLAANLPALFAWVEAGGTVIVQYNTQTPLQASTLAPFPVRISSDRVVDERAPMTFLAPEHTALNTPNKITAADFDGWVQERGLYFPNQWDEHFTPILASNDAGEAPTQGGLLIARHGRGYYVYTGLSFFRQLPAGVPGAYRLFANLVSLGK